LNDLRYAGYNSAPDGGGEFIKLRCENIISLELFNDVQDKLANQGKNNGHDRRKNESDEFLLTGTLICSKCGINLTSCHSKGRNGTVYPYYLYQETKKQCDHGRKSVGRAKVHKEFLELLKGVTPSPTIIKALGLILKEKYTAGLENQQVAKAKIRSEYKQLEKRQKGLLEKIIKVNNDDVLKMLEDEAANLKAELTDKEIELQRYNDAKFDLVELIETAELLLQNPSRLWLEGDLSKKKMVQKLVFPQKLKYDKNNGIETPSKSLLFSVCEGLGRGKLDMVLSAGVEPARPCGQGILSTGNNCKILIYQHICNLVPSVKGLYFIRFKQYFDPWVEIVNLRLLKFKHHFNQNLTGVKNVNKTTN